MSLFKVALAAGAALVISAPSFADPIRQTTNNWRDAFRQLEDEDWPTPNRERRATGAPGPDYWQQQVDYDIDVAFDENSKVLTGSATVTYTNNAPDTLDYLWFLMDQNRFRPDSIAVMTETVGGASRANSRTGAAASVDGVSARTLNRAQRLDEDGLGFNINGVTLEDGSALDYTVVDTLMRIDLPETLETGDSVTFTIDWDHVLIETAVIGGRSGWECFDEDGEGGDCIYQMAQWFPRAAAFSDYEGWHNKAFLGRGEFTLEFGDYDVAITVPQDFVVAATGELQNADAVLTEAQRERLEDAATADEPVFIITPDEARANERRGTRSTTTWEFSAENVRDFAWATSRKFIWDAVGVEQDGGGQAPDRVMAMSFYPNEAEPLWSTYSTRAIEHTIDVYNEFSFPYPYPTAQSISGPQGGMEYPMITFNGASYGRPVIGEDGELTYSRRAKHGLIGVIIHEIGHIYFPMTVNSDERQWTWMDEGLNTFLQFQAERRWSEDYPVRRGDPDLIADYMVSTNQVPIMTQSDSIPQFGNNAYGKPATALVVLRETVLGRELFDRAFREYSERWRFKRPTPYDFFRTMEESSGVDLDWFWRGWFYSTDHVDIAITSVTEGTVNTEDPEIENALDRQRDADTSNSTTLQNNIEEGLAFYENENPEVQDFYSANDPHVVTNRQREAYEGLRDGDLPEHEAAALDYDGYVYFVNLENQGGVVMPVILEFSFADGSTDEVRIPAEIWRFNPDSAIWRYITDKQVVSVELDPHLETADADRTDNYYPPQIQPSRLEVYRNTSSPSSLMDDMDLRVERDSIQTRDQ